MLGALTSVCRADDPVGRIDRIWVAPASPFVMFTLKEPPEEFSRCNKSGRFSIDLTRPGGRATYEMLRLAKSGKYTVSVEGLNTCNPYEAENVKNIVVQ